MSWWRKFSGARMLAVICVGEHRSQAAHTYTETIRRIERGNLDAFDHAGQHVTVHAISGEHFIAPIATSFWGDQLPQDIRALVRISDDAVLQTTEVNPGGTRGVSVCTRHSTPTSW